MNVQMAFQAPSKAEWRRPRCPRCNSTLLLAEESAFDLAGRIKHTWSCEACGNEFVTSITVLPRQA